MTSPFKGQVRDRTQTLIATLVGDEQAPPARRILEEAGTLLRAQPLDRRNRAGRQMVASMAGVYFAWLRPDGSWKAEVNPDLAGQDNIVWRHEDGGLIADVVSAADHRTPPLTDKVGELVGGLLTAGEQRYDEAFRGVRVVTLFAPRSSLLVCRGHTPEPLIGTDLWFDTPRSSAEGVA